MLEAKTRKLTVRLDAEGLSDLQSLSKEIGASQTAIIQAMIHEMAQTWARCPNATVDRTRFVEKARRIDEERRRRSESAD